MKIVNWLLDLGTRALRAWNRWLCPHPNPTFEGNGITLIGHRELSEQFWRCAICGKRYSKPGYFDGDSAKIENVFFEGAEAYMRGKTIFDCPYKDLAQRLAWRRGYHLEARRFRP